ncbi:MAG: hypothetical protein ACM3VW_06460 [Bacteroidota bacterium]
MIRAASINRRGRVCLWLLALALSFGCCALACAQGQYESAREAMGPALLTGPVLGNRIAPPDVGRGPRQPSPKPRVQALPVPQTPPPAPGTPPPPSGPGQEPTAPATAEAEQGRPLPPNAQQPGPGPVPAPEVPPVAPPERPETPPGPDQVQIRGDRLQDTPQGTTVEGNVELRYQDLTVRGERAELDPDRIWGAFPGPVSLEAKLYKALGQDLRVNLDTENWQVRDGAAEVSPEFFGEYVAEALYVRAQQITGRPGEVIGRDGIGTSCNYWPDPHWMMRSNEVIYHPDQDVTFRKPTLYFFGHRLLRYPWDLHLSLVRKENRFLPEIGQNDVEGFYAKFAYGYILDEANDGFIRFQLTTKRGVGFGVDHTLDALRQQGQLSLFFEPSEGSFSGRLNHHAQISRLFSSNVSSSFQQDSGYGLGSESMNTDITFRYDTLRSQSLLGFQHSLVSGDFSTSRRFSSNFTHRERIGTDGDISLRASYRSSSFSQQEAADEELETELAWRQQFTHFGIDLLAQKRYDLDASRFAGDDSFYTLNRTPDIALNTASDRLGDLRLFGSAFDATLYLGHFEQHPDELDIYRAGIDLRLPGHIVEFGGRASLRTSGRFQQMFFSDGSAQWVGQFDTEYRRQLSRSWDSRLSFSYLRPNGFSPLRLDYFSPTSILYWQAVRLVPDKMRLDFTFGRDFHNNFYQDALLRAEIMLSERNRIEAQGGYSVELAQWRPLNLRWIYATERNWWSAVTINYDLDQSDLTNISFDIDWLPSEKWRLQFLGGYSGSGGLDQADIRITRDLHCMLASLTYINSTNEIRFGLGIKAFPSDTRTFGVGGRGQYFESNFGDQY